MKKRFGPFALTLLLALVPAFPAAQGAPKGADLICPVTFLPIGSPSLAVGKSVYKGKTYYFCTADCKRLFDKNPAKYAKKAK